jgi:SAM-dependent methyltransferase
VRFIYFITWEKAQVFNCPPSASQTVGCHAFWTMRTILLLGTFFLTGAFTKGYHTLHFEDFSIQVPKNWKYIKRQGIDSFVGEIRGSKVNLSFDCSEYILHENIFYELFVYCDFINNIKAAKKYAVDINPDGYKFCDANVEFINSSINHIAKIKHNSIDVLFASNLLEHLDDKELDQALSEFNRILKTGARVILLQPNFRYAYKEYFDDYTHKKIFTHVSLRDYFEARSYKPLNVLPKFLPFSLKSKLPKSYLLTKLYLASFYKPMAKQMLLVLEKI